MHKSFGKIRIAELIIFSAMLTGCASLLLPEMRVESCTWDKESVSIVFSLEPDMTSIVKAFSLTEDEQPSSGIFSRSGKEVRFFPVGGIKTNYDYVLTVSSSAESEKGYSLGADYCRTFSTRTDSVRPEIISFAPSNGSFVADVPDITISFSEPVARESFEAAVSVSPPFSYAKIFFDGDRSVRLVPTEKPKANTLYKITVSESLEDCARNALAKEFHTSFYYRHDSDLPLCTFSLKNKKGFQTEVLSGGVYSSVPKDCIIGMDFSKEMNIDSLSSYVSIIPTASYSIKTNALDKTHAELVFDAPAWGKTYTFRMRKGVQAVSGNKTESDTNFDICFNAEGDKPVEFVKGFLQTGVWSAGNLSEGVHYKTINGESNFSALLFDPVFFPVSSDTACTLYLVFSVSRESAGIDMLSMFDSLSIAATNGCCSAVIKTFAVLSPDDCAQFPVNELIALTDGMSIVKAGLEIRNGSKAGIVTITLGDGIKDSLGNTMRAKRVFTFTK
ncbi:Ig-like domain-containing protein [Treponema socranskii subsp. buccale]|uniref:Ig-like domain-containing protein n=1 Tax=Treponema socranskii TaxID=53419 RepID=UPI0020A4FFC7|nr:Ig-like domain-containing protein [Treponema socranskii]UTD03626.1 Ig-like domain-containing protein [Treponema socranskii subsp. buccale]